jgi:SAM-dependent methyltransferase
VEIKHNADNNTSMASLDPQFDQFADDYDKALNQGLSVSGEDKNYFARGRMAHLRKVLGDGIGSVLDYGCGTGSAAPFAKESFPNSTIIGTDISEKSLNVARKVHGNIARFQLMDDIKANGDIDLVFCNGVFHHIPLGAREGCLKFIHDRLKPGGHFALFENNPWNPGTRLVMKRIPFDKDAITLSPSYAKKMLKNAGFEIVGFDFLFYFPRALAFLRFVEPALVKIPLGAQYLALGRKKAWG